MARGPHGKAGDWRAQAHVEIQHALAARAGARAPRQGKGDEPRSVARQLFELRLRGERVEDRRHARRRQAARERPETELRLARARAEARMAAAKACPGVPSLVALCSARMTDMLWGAEDDPQDLATLSLFPENLKTELLVQAAAVSRTTRDPLVGDALLESLLDSNMTELCLAHSRVTDAVAKLVDPQLLNQTPSGVTGVEAVLDSWEAMPLVAVRGLPRLVELDLSFCAQISEDIVDLLADSSPGLRRLWLTGNLNDNHDGAVYMLGRLGGLRVLEFLGVSCCFWFSLGALVHAGVLQDPNAASPRLLVDARDCPLVSAEVASPSLPRLLEGCVLATSLESPPILGPDSEHVVSVRLRDRGTSARRELLAATSEPPAAVAAAASAG